MKDVQLITNSKSIVLKVKDQEIGNFNDFTSKEEYLELLELIKQHIPAIAQQSSTPTNKPLAS